MTKNKVAPFYLGHGVVTTFTLLVGHLGGHLDYKSAALAIISSAQR